MLYAALIVIALLLLAIEIKVGTYGASAMVGAVLLSLTALNFTHGHPGWPPAFPIAISISLGLIAAFQGVLALRTRRSGCLAGSEELVNTFGVSCTEIGDHGTVFVRGEYWQATSPQLIPRGSRVRIERVHGLTLYVKEA